MTVRRPAASAPRLLLVAGAGGVRVEGDKETRLGHPLTGDHLDPGPPAEGVFAGWSWDGERLVARNDRYGICPLFYRAGGSSLALSPDPLALLPDDGPAELDHDALAVFLRTGFFLAEDTAFAEVRALPPAATLTWDTGGPRLRSGGPPHPGPATMTGTQAVDGFVELFRASVARRLTDEPYDLLLSGGRDSRHILLELCRQGAPPRRCVSGAKFPPDPGADARVAAVLAGRLGLPHTVVPRPRAQFRAELSALPAQGMTTLDGAWIQPLLAHLLRHSRVSYDGLGGGELAQNPSVDFIRAHPYDPADLPGLADRMLDAGRTGPHVEHLLGPRTSVLWSRRAARRRLVTELARHADSACPLSSFFFWNRTRRSISAAPFALGDGRLLTHTPYLDHGLFDHLAAVPHRFLVDGTFHDRALHKAFPEHADLGFASAAPQQHGPVLVAHRLAYLLRFLAHAVVVEPAWWRSPDRFLQRLLAAGRGAGAPQRVSRLQPLALYLLQLEGLATRGAGHRP
ncbi:MULTISPECIES: asparagine synthase-related protein [unclassified Streptomyces]|uniref:asparagine synthase-related protein n=1 Tax=unclassified Streptomyces TaxID=2593676 RepID=UPI0007ECDD0E|nr:MULTISPECIES: asparagine synthase-related protein [unclassified Streptomyces]MCP3770125.1 asparagine synthase-related protein [Streptomyces sp. MAR25Y5]OBQ54358.1 asparagine synthase [Streptomyces sp. H-KF8]